ILASAAVGLVMLARRSFLLRDPHIRVPPGGVPPYSLGRFQMAFWFFLVVASYVFVWMITDELDTLTPSVLGLLGICSGTALGASLIEGDGSAPEKKPESAPAAEEPT